MKISVETKTKLASKEVPVEFRDVLYRLIETRNIFTDECANKVIDYYCKNPILIGNDRKGLLFFDEDEFEHIANRLQKIMLVNIQYFDEVWSRADFYYSDNTIEATRFEQSLTSFIIDLDHLIDLAAKTVEFYKQTRKTLPKVQKTVSDNRKGLLQITVQSVDVIILHIKHIVNFVTKHAFIIERLQSSYRKLQKEIYNLKNKNAELQEQVDILSSQLKNADIIKQIELLSSDELIKLKLLLDIQGAEQIKALEEKVTLFEIALQNRFVKKDGSEKNPKPPIVQKSLLRE